MSEEVDTLFQISYNGMFVTHSSGEIAYEGGEVHVLHTQPKALFVGLLSGFPISLYGQRMWYKMPYEDLKLLKVLCDGSENFQKMCEAANWTKHVDIFMEHENIGEETNRNGGTERGQSNAAPEEGRNNATTEEDGENEFDEDGRVEAVVGVICDDEENENYRDTPPVSDNEEEEEEEGEEPRQNPVRPMPYDRWKRGSGELQIRQCFDSVQEFKEAVLEYALKGGWNIQFKRWGRVKSEAVCGVEVDEDEVPCAWRIYCSYEQSVSHWMVKTFQDVHTCYKDGRCKILQDNHIATMFLDELRLDPEMKPREIQKQVQLRYDLNPTDDQCRKAKKKALKIIQGEYDEQYRRIKDYENEIHETNKESSTELSTKIGAGGLEVFERFYVCYAVLRDTWLDSCRPIFGIDGCFLKNETKGQLLAAVGRDANNQIYPLAWAVVNVENKDNWIWFLQKLKKDLDLRNGDGFTLVSDRQKGLLSAVEQELPFVEHRMCARHIYGNLRKKFGTSKPEMKKLFWRVVESHNEADYRENLKALKEYDSEVYEALMVRKPETCSRAFFKTTCSCEDALNNNSESYNSTLEKARAMPLVEMLETMRRQAMVRIDIRKNVSKRHKGKFSLKVSKMIAAETVFRKHCKSLPGPNEQFEVREGVDSYAVNMRARTCTCRRWDLTGIPCRHALRVVLDNKKTYKMDNLVSHWYLTSKWQKQYSDSINPMRGIKFWKQYGEATIEPPTREEQKGRKKKPAQIIKGVNESPTKGKKVTRHANVMNCYRCGMPAHNSSKCPNGGVPFKPRPPKKNKLSESHAEAMTLNCGEGPSQSQPSQT